MYAILFLSVSLLLIAISFTFSIFNDTRQSFNQVEKSDEVIANVSAFESYLYKTEAKVRLAVISNNDDDIKLQESYNEGKRRINGIQALISDSVEYKRSDSLSMLLDERFAIWNRISEALKSPLSSQYLASSLTISGSHVTNKIVELTNGIRNRQKIFLRENIEMTRHGIIVISVVLMVSTLFSLLCIFFAFGRLHAEIKKEINVQRKLEHKIQELDRSNTHLERFAYTASHDLQEPLRKLHTFSEKLVLQEKNNLSPEGKEIIDRMQKFVDRMHRLIEDLLLFSRIISYKLVKVPIDLNKVLTEVKQSMSENISRSGAVISADPLPLVMGYESQLQQLFQNLISNSIRYAKKDEHPIIKITTSLVTGDRIVGVKTGDETKKFNLIVFSDNGIGFDNKYAEKIFEIFQRLHGKSEYEGTGIGLAICKLVTENHDGYIRATGAEGVGTHFMTYFPVI